MASSGVRSAMGRPLRTGSCLSFVPAALAEGISFPRDEKVARERKHARNARGVRRTRARRPGEDGLESWRGDIRIMLRLTPGDGISCWAKRRCGLRIGGGVERGWVLPHRGL